MHEVPWRSESAKLHLTEKKKIERKEAKSISGNKG